MGRWFRDHDVAPRTDARILTDGDLPAAARLCAVDPVATVLAGSHIADARTYGLQTSGGELWGFPRTGPLTAVCWAGANLVPVVPPLAGGRGPEVSGTAEERAPVDDALHAFARLALHRGRRSSSIVGPAHLVMGMWRFLEDDWPAAREIRADQPSMAIRSAPLVPIDPDVRVAAPDDFGIVLPASVAMFTEEVGYSPIVAGGAAYAARVRSLLEQGRTYAHVVPTGMPVAGAGVSPAGPRTAGDRSAGEDRTVVFKADLGAVTDDVAQVQGVWVDPAFRGQGRSETGMAAVVEHALRRVPCVSLYVNGFNTRAMAAYKRVGFEQVGTYATVLF